MTKSMTEGKPLPLILQFAVPLLIGNLLQQTYIIMNQCSLQYGANTVFVGNVHQFSTPQIP